MSFTNEDIIYYVSSMTTKTGHKLSAETTRIYVSRFKTLTHRQGLNHVFTPKRFIEYLEDMSSANRAAMLKFVIKLLRHLKKEEYSKHWPEQIEHDFYRIHSIINEYARQSRCTNW